MQMISDALRKIDFKTATRSNAPAETPKSEMSVFHILWTRQAFQQLFNWFLCEMVEYLRNERWRQNLHKRILLSLCQIRYTEIVSGAVSL